MPNPEPHPFAAAPAFRKALLAWFARHQRPLPWRTEVSAYRTVVSELMCQQTQIATVIPYFERWTAKWPDFKELARAEEAEAMALWAGLGYYSRARNLLALARQVAALPRPPRTAAEWREFKGVGPYTAAAIARRYSEMKNVGFRMRRRPGNILKTNDAVQCRSTTYFSTSSTEMEKKSAPVFVEC